MDAVADALVGRAVRLALRPGLDPMYAVAELSACADGAVDALDVARARLRALAREGGGETLQLAVDLLAEAISAPRVVRLPDVAAS